MCANDNVLNAFIPLIRELVHYISKREYDRIDIFSHKNGALDKLSEIGRASCRERV